MKIIEPPRRGDAEKSGFPVLVFAFLLFTFSFAALAQDDTRISATWQVQKYDITATSPSADTDRNMTVRAKLDLKNVSPRPAASLTFRISPNATVSTITVNGSPAEFTKAEEKLGNASLQRIAVRMPAVAPGANITAVVDYKLNVKENSGLASISPVGLQFLPLSFWYPTPNSWYFARGADYAPVRIQVNAAGQNLVSTGSESSGAFDQRLLVQPFFVTGNFEKIPANGVEVFIPKDAGPEERKRAGEVAALAVDAKNFYSVQVGTSPDSPLRIVFVKRGGGFSSGGTVLVDESVLRRPKLDSATVMAVSEGVAKLWFADAVRTNGDGSGAIREGFTRFYATQFVENKFGKGIADIERMRHRNAYSNVAQRDAPIIQVAPLDDYYFSTVANKGSMIWRLLNRRVGSDEFNKRVRSALQDGNVTLAEIRELFPEQKDFLDAMFDKVTDTNLLVGLPQQGAGETKAALRNTGSIDATVNVSATLVNGEKLNAPVTIRAASFGEVVFKTPLKVVRLEVDSEKLYPQTEYSDDVAPRELTDSDLLLAVKRSFDKQEFAAAEATANKVLRDFPNFDEVRILLGRSLLAQNKNAEAEREFRAVIDEKLPTARSLAWANLGLAETALRGGNSAQAVKFAEDAIRIDADYGASLAARLLRNKVAASSAVPEDVKAYFTGFDRAATSNRKAELEAATVGGEVSRFVSGVSGNVVEWKTQPMHVDRLSADAMLVESQMTLKLLNREVETGMAVYRLVRTPSGWKLYSVDIFEVR